MSPWQENPGRPSERLWQKQRNTVKRWRARSWKKGVLFCGLFLPNLHSPPLTSTKDFFPHDMQVQWRTAMWNLTSQSSYCAPVDWPCNRSWSWISDGITTIFVRHLPMTNAHSASQKRETLGKTKSERRSKLKTKIIIINKIAVREHWIQWGI